MSLEKFLFTIEIKKIVIALYMATGFKRIAVLDEHTCATCREHDGAILMDAVELYSLCSADVCRCVVEPKE